MKRSASPPAPPAKTTKLSQDCGKAKEGEEKKTIAKSNLARLSEHLGLTKSRARPQIPPSGTQVATSKVRMGPLSSKPSGAPAHDHDVKAPWASSRNPTQPSERQTTTFNSGYGPVGHNIGRPLETTPASSAQFTFSTPTQRSFPESQGFTANGKHAANVAVAAPATNVDLTKGKHSATTPASGADNMLRQPLQTIDVTISTAMKRLGLTHEKRPEPATISAEGMSNAADPLDHTLKQISLEAQRDMKKAKDSVDDFEELFEWLRNFIDIDENSQQKLKCDMKRVHTRLDIDTRRLIQLAEINVGLRRVEQQKTADLESLTNQLLALKEKVTVNEAATSQKYVELQSCKKLLNTARTALQQKENELEQLQKQIKKGTMHPMAQSKQEEAIRLESEKALERTKKEMTDAVDALRKRLAEVESRHEEFQRRHTAIQAEYEKLVIQLRGKQDLEVEIKTKDEQIKKLKSQITAEKFTPASQAEIEKAQDALQRAIKAENDLKQIKLSKDKAISRLQQENGDLEKKLEHQESKIETMGKKIEDMTQAKEELTLKQTQYVDPEVENENIRLRDENYELDKQLKEEQKRREDAEQLAAELKMKLERQQPTFIPAPPTVHADEGDDDALESAVRKYEEDLAKAEGELNSVRQELDGVNTEIDQEEISMSSANVQGETAETEEAEEDASDKPVETVETELSGTAARNETTPTADLAFLVPDAVPEQQPRTSSKRGGDDAFPPLARSKPAPQSSNEAKKMKPTQVVAIRDRIQADYAKAARQVSTRSTIHSAVRAAKQRHVPRKNNILRESEDELPATGAQHAMFGAGGARSSEAICRTAKDAHNAQNDRN